MLTPEQRRMVMSRIRGKDTKLEMTIRRGLHAQGLRYRIHKVGIPGKPDMVLAKYHTVLFTHGCFWHGHGCSLFKWPRTRVAFWKNKINRSKERDQETLVALEKQGWRVLVIWECALKGRQKKELADVLTSARNFILKGEKPFGEIKEVRRVQISDK